MEAQPCDATTLIYLAKANAFDPIGRAVPELLAPPGVWDEAVVAGQAKGAPEVAVIQAAEASGAIRRVDLTPEQRDTAVDIAIRHRLGRGESEVLALAPSLTDPRAIVDEGRGARVGTALGVHVLSTIFLPVAGFREGVFAKDEALQLVRRLAAVVGVRADALLAIEEHLRKDFG